MSSGPVYMCRKENELGARIDFYVKQRVGRAYANVQKDIRAQSLCTCLGSYSAQCICTYVQEDVKAQSLCKCAEDVRAKLMCTKMLELRAYAHMQGVARAHGLCTYAIRYKSSELMQMHRC